MRNLSMLMAAALALVPATTQAQTWEHSWTLCTTSFINACGDISLTTEAIFTEAVRTGTSISVAIHNLQGQGFVGDNTLASGIHEVFLAGPGIIAGQLNGTTAGVGAGGATGTGTWDWYTGSYVAGIGPIGFVSVRSAPIGQTAMVGGCSELPLTFGLQVTSRTCAPESTWTLAFDLPYIVDANQFDGIYMYAAATTFGSWCWHNRENFISDSMGDCAVYGESLSQLGATPEPITMGLIATGLAGIGGARLRRRRKRLAGSV